MQTSSSNRLRAILVLVALAGTILFNYFSATGRINSVTPGEISARYPSTITPANYAFTIWSLIYLLLCIFSFYQLKQAAKEKLADIRPLFILSCFLNCLWIYLWHLEFITVCFLVILALAFNLLYIVYLASFKNSAADLWFVRFPFGIYAGWVSAATLVNLAIVLNFYGILGLAPGIISSILILTAGVLSIAARVLLKDYFFPLSIAWALTAIAIANSANTVVTVSAAIGVVISLIASASCVIDLPTRQQAS